MKNSDLPRFDLGLGLFDGIPQKKLFRKAVKIQILAALVWDYCDTVINIASQMRISPTKRLSRKIRQLREEYNQRESRSLDKEHCDRAVELSELFESINMSYFDRLCAGLQLELRRNDKLRPDFETLAIAVQMALTVIDVLHLYCIDTDFFISKYFPSADNSIFPKEIQPLMTLLPMYVMDVDLKNSESRRITVRALLNEIKNLDIYDDDGKL